MNSKVRIRNPPHPPSPSFMKRPLRDAFSPLRGGEVTQQVLRQNERAFLRGFVDPPVCPARGQRFSYTVKVVT